MNTGTLIGWPATIPLPYCDYTGGPRNATIVSRDDIATARRSRFHKDYQTLQLTWQLTPIQLALFKTFWLESLGNGTGQFYIDLLFPKNSATESWVVKPIGEGYKARWNEGRWELQFEVDVLMPHELPEVADILGWTEYFAIPTGAQPADADVQYETADGFVYTVRTP